MIRALSARLQDIPHITTREPGAGDLGSELRRLLLESSEMPPRAELFLFLADRVNHMVTVVEPALSEGKLVLCDRHADSTLVYQGYARGLDVELIRQMNRFATNDRRPDLILLIDLEAEAGQSRVTDRNRLDNEPLEFHRKIRSGFLEESRRDPDRWVVIDGSLPVEQVVEACAKAIGSKMGLAF